MHMFAEWELSGLPFWLCSSMVSLKVVQTGGWLRWVELEERWWWLWQRPVVHLPPQSCHHQTTWWLDLQLCPNYFLSLHHLVQRAFFCKLLFLVFMQDAPCLVCWFFRSFMSEACACFWGMFVRGCAC